MEYDQMNLESCTKSKNCVSLRKVTDMVPANKPPMSIKGFGNAFGGFSAVLLMFIQQSCLLYSSV